MCLSLEHILRQMKVLLSKQTNLFFKFLLYAPFVIAVQFESCARQSVDFVSKFERKKTVEKYISKIIGLDAAAHEKV